MGAAPWAATGYIHAAVRNRARNCVRHARGRDLESLQVSKIGTWKSEFFFNICRHKVDNNVRSNFGCSRDASTQLRATAFATA